MEKSKKCKHFGICSGCQYQDTNYNEELRIKSKILKSRVKDFHYLTIDPIIPSDNFEYYRNKIQLPVGQHNGKLTIGPHRIKTGEVIDLKECYIQNKYLTKLVLFLRDIFREDKLIPFDIKSNKGDLKYIVARISNFTNQIVLGIVFNKIEENKMMSILNRLNEQLVIFNSINQPAEVVSLNYQVLKDKTTFIDNSKFLLYDGIDRIIEKIDRFKFELNIKTFFQVNPSIIPKLYTSISKSISKTNIIYDLYGGVGSIATWLSHLSKEIVSVELNQDSHNFGKISLKLNSIDNLKLVHGDVGNYLNKNILKKNSVVIVDPSRVGMGNKATFGLLKSKPIQIIYVSCYYESFFHDFSLLKKDYTLSKIIPVDLFPRTEHLESIFILNRKDL